MNKLVVVAMVGILSAGLVGCSAENSEPEKVEPESTEASTESSSADKETADKKKEEKVTDKVFAVGDSIKKEGKVLTVTGVERSQGTEYDTPDKGKEYMVVTVDIKNKGDKNISYNPFNYSMQNAQGQITDQAFSMIDEETHLDSGELIPGGNVSGTMVFQVPADSTNKDLILLMKDNMFSDKSVKVNLASK
ncbi:DUF4352 domain-containing protein [Virgibacillus sp. DJP39]|uniref:DUF4352 domain-containing protein n=1 Tax=Virgibacillus sp. DJP39 TaxID=3409790 RepID=UPI003BB51085